MSGSGSAVSPGGEIRLKLFGRTDVGQIREHNEDNFLIADLTRQSRSLMEQDRESRTKLFAWLGDVRLIRTVHARHFAAMPFDRWCEELLAELVANGALRIEGDAVANA